jgi:hypothetical protein
MVKNLPETRAKKGTRNKLVLGFAGAAAAAVIGSAGVAAAHPLGPTVTLPSRAACANFKMYHFKNRGQCVKAYNQALKHHHGQGHGYGYGNGGTKINTAVTVNVNGDNNVVDVVVNYFFG